MKKNKSYLTAFILVTSLFFLWGFAHNLDPILIPHLKKSFTLSVLQASLVDFAVFIAYFIMALPAGYLMKKFGYKSGIIIGLLFFAIGSLLFIPAANTQAYGFFLGALFIIACGLTILETAANPYVSLLGPPESAAQRLNFAQSFNGLATTLAPIVGAKLILVKGTSDQELNGMTEAAKKIALASEASSVKMPYLILGCIILLVALFFYFTKLPEIKEQEDQAAASRSISHAFRHTHLKWSVVAQFFYVGAQVCVFSFFILFATKALPADATKDGFILAIEKILKSLGIVNSFSQSDYYSYYLATGGLMFMIGRFIGTFLMKFIRPNILLTTYALVSSVLCIIAMKGTGVTAVYAVLGIFFFMSIMFPTIFSLGIKDLGADTKYGSSLIIMSIVGGAVLPLIFGKISDATNNIQLGYIVPMICFAVVAFFGWKGYQVKSINN